MVDKTRRFDALPSVSIYIIYITITGGRLIIAPSDSIFHGYISGSRVVRGFIVVGAKIAHSSFACFTL